MSWRQETGSALEKKIPQNPVPKMRIEGARRMARY
jgi:hypothetical protein